MALDNHLNQVILSLNLNTTLVTNHSNNNVLPLSLILGTLLNNNDRHLNIIIIHHNLLK
jgi:hypothetical protein